MATEPNYKSIEVDQLLLNAQLRTELEPYLDESVSLVDTNQLTTQSENEFLASMLAWEKAPVLPICKWFDPVLVLPPPDSMSGEELSEILVETIDRLYQEKIVLDFTSHLSDHDLYCLIIRDILPASEKKVDLPKNYLHWHCIDSADDQETWLRYYASNRDRESWQEQTGQTLPSKEEPPFPRIMPRRPY
ncbi:MAG: hypothetical protein VX438_01015 [Planctomycetota bacterium]|jgi:hypothetical protein|nr:hypothetical protein [Planctomycetota bacterium]